MLEDIQSKNLVKTFLSYSIPCIIGMLLTSCITIVDGLFIGWKLGEKGLAAVNLTLPVLFLLLAVTIMVGVGGVTLGAQCLGAKDSKKANQHFTFSVIVNAAAITVMALVLILFQDRIISMLNAKGEMFGYVKSFLGTMAYFYVFMMVNNTFSMFIRSEGKPQLSLMFGIAGNILNVILDYIFIMKLDFGMKGAAFASGISVLIPFLFGILYFTSKKSVYKFTKIKFEMQNLKTILFFGSAEFVAQVSSSITVFAFNWILLKRMGVNGVAAMTIVGYISFIQNMILTGIAIGIHPIISYSFGAKNRDTILNLFSIAVKAVLTVGIAVFAVSFIAADPIVRIFAKDNLQLVETAKDGLKLYAVAFLLNGYNIIAAAYFTSLGEAKAAAIISTLRSLVLVIGFVVVLPYLLGNTGIWLTAPMTEITTFVVAYIFISKSKAKLLLSETGQSLPA
ncbi:MAG: MATE family efflux transporter [Clostridia bacterium]|nr:MATE family efflux transporter [Clostridia bacterium]